MIKYATMSPEYVIVKNSKTRKAEVQVNMLPDEDARELRKETMTAYVAQSHLKYEDGIFKAKEVLLKVLPQEIVNEFVQAFIDIREGASVAFKKTEEGKYKIVGKNLPSMSRKKRRIKKI